MNRIVDKSERELRKVSKLNRTSFCKRKWKLAVDKVKALTAFLAVAEKARNNKDR